MKVLIVDDNDEFVRQTIDLLAKNGFKVFGVSPDGSAKPKLFGCEVERQAVMEAEVIFLDHDLGEKTGDEWLTSWQDQFSFSGKRVIGISSHSEQAYLLWRLHGPSPKDILDYAKNLTEQ